MVAKHADHGVVSVEACVALCRILMRRIVPCKYDTHLGVLKYVGDFCAGVQMHEAPPDTYVPEYDIEEEENADVRLGKYACDHLVVRETEYYEDDRDHFGD